MYDTIVIGAGPAGLTAALYASRRLLKTLLLSRDLGGQAAKTFDIENYPGFTKISGIELAKKMKEQAESFGTEFHYEETKEIVPTKEGFLIKTLNNEYKTKSVILAFGKQPRELGVPGEQEFKGRGVSYCATCDAPFYGGKTVVVVGGGNSALDGAILSSKIAKKIYLVHRSSFSGEQIMIDRVKKIDNIEIIMPNNIKEIKGDKVVTGVLLESGKVLEADGVLIEVGYTVDRTLVNGLLDLNEKNQIITNITQETSVPGIFAAGDLTTTPYKQIVVAAGEGAKAALSAYDYIQRVEGKKGITGDWQKINKS